MVELVVAAGIISVLLLASASAMGRSVESTNSSRNMTRGALFLESVREDMAALEPTEILSLNGQAFYSLDDWANARHRVDVQVFSISADLVQVQLTLIDQQTGAAVANIHGMRAIV